MVRSRYSENYIATISCTWEWASNHVGPRTGSTIAVGWVKPPLNWVKLNTYGFALGNPRLVGGGGIIRDCNGNWVFGFARAIGFTSSISVELWAVRDGLARCCGLSIAAVEIDIDVFVAISLLSHSTSTNGELSSLIEDCRNLMKNIPQV